MRQNFTEAIENGLPIKVNAASIVPEYEFMIRLIDQQARQLRTPAPVEEAWEGEDAMEKGYVDVGADDTSEGDRGAPLRNTVRRNTPVTGDLRPKAAPDNSPTSPGAMKAREMSEAS